MPLRIDLGSVGSAALAVDGDLAKYLQPGVDSAIKLGSQVLGSLDSRIADAPAGSVSMTFNFNVAPSWTIAQTVGITLSVKPQAVCTLRILRPGDTLFSYALGQDSQDTPVKVPYHTYYVSIGLKCSLQVEAGASWSSGNFGVSGNISTDDEFTIANYYAVPAAVLLRDAIVQAFGNFVLPFHADSIERLPAGDYVDFEFIGKLALGFGATYGFSHMFFGGNTGGEVSASFGTPIGKTVVSAAPSVQVGASFKLQYTHYDAFRVVAGRTAKGATLYLLRKDASGFTTKERAGITLSAGAKFQTDASQLKAETQSAARTLLPGPAGSLLAGKLAPLADQAAGDINDAVNGLLAKADGQQIGLELTQSRTRENTALFIYTFDFSLGAIGYEAAMRGDYATALTMPGVELDTRSFIEQVYTSSAGLKLQFFDLLKFQDVTQYIQDTTIAYLGSRTFQIRRTAGVKSISGLFGKERDADLYFIAQCRSVVRQTAISQVDVRLNAIFTDRNNSAAFEQSRRMLEGLGLGAAAAQVRAYVLRHPKGVVQVTIDVDANQLAGLDSDAYLAKGKPPAEPHRRDQRNYEQFVRSVATVIGQSDTVAQTFEEFFSRYQEWLAFNRVVTDEQGSTKPGDRLSVGNPNGDNWPEGYPPNDRSSRLLVQTYILAGQAFMNICDSIKDLIPSLPGIDDQAKFDELYDGLVEMVNHDVPFPSYFLKSSILALLSVAGISITLDGDMPDSNSSAAFTLKLKASAAATD